MIPGRLIAALACALASCALLPALAAAKPGDLIVADEGFLTPGEVIRIDPATGTATSILTRAENSFSDVAFGRDGALFVIDRDFPGAPDYPGTLYRFDLLTAALSPIVSGAPFQTPIGINASSDGQVLVADEDAGGTTGNPPGRLFRVDPASGARTMFSSDPILRDPRGIVSAPSGEILVADRSTTVAPRDGAILKVDPVTGVATPLYKPVFEDGSYVRDLARRPDGKLIVLISSFNEPDAKQLILLDPATGAVAPILSAVGPWGIPSSLAIAADGAIYVTSQGTVNSVLRVDPVTNAITPVFTGPPLESPDGIAIEPPLCGKRPATIVGSSGRDRLIGSPYADVIAGLGAGDRIKGGKGRDLICGGPGRDRISGGKGKDRCLGGKGRDRGSCERGKL